MTKWILSIGVIVALLAGCSGRPTTGGETSHAREATEVYDRFNSLTGPERDSQLAEAAKSEGELSLYTSNVSLQSFVDAFTEEYDIPVTVYQATSESILQRVTQEMQADHQGADIIETNGTELTVMDRGGSLAPYRSELREHVREDGQFEDWTATRFNMFVIAWNTDRVPDGQQPKTLEDLADPAYHGRVGMEVGDSDWFATMYEFYRDKGMSEADVDKLFQAIAGNSKIVNGHTTQVQLLGAGQFDLTVSAYSHNVETAADDGAPIAWRTADSQLAQPVVLRPNGAGLAKNAAHPAAATLFMDFLLSPQGQQIIAESHQLGSVVTDHDPLQGVQTITVDVPSYLDKTKEWNERYDKLLRGASK